MPAASDGHYPGLGSPEGWKQPFAPGDADSFLDLNAALAGGKSFADGGSDCSCSAGGATEVTEWAVWEAAALCPLCPVLRGGAEAQVGGVHAAGFIAAVAQTWIVGARPAQAGDDAVLELVGEQMCGDGAAAGAAGEAGGAEAAVTRRRDAGRPDPAGVCGPQ